MQFANSMTGAARNLTSRSTRPWLHGTGSHSDSTPYASSMINLRLAAICRLAYEASDRGLLSSDLAAGIRGVEGVRGWGVRVGNWLTAEGGKKLLRAEAASAMV